MTRKQWYVAGASAAATSAAACCCLDHVTKFEVYDRFWEPLAVTLIVSCIWMVVAGYLWSRVGVRRVIVGSAIFNLFIPVLLTSILSAFDLDPNIHGSYALIFLFEFFSLLTMIAMLLGTFTSSRTHTHA